MTEYKIFELTATSSAGTHRLKVRAPGEAVALGMADAKVSDEHGVWVGWDGWTIKEIPATCATHPGCDGADDTHAAISK